MKFIDLLKYVEYAYGTTILPVSHVDVAIGHLPKLPKCQHYSNDSSAVCFISMPSCVLISYDPKH